MSQPTSQPNHQVEWERKDRFDVNRATHVMTFASPFSFQLITSHPQSPTFFSTSVAKGELNWTDQERREHESTCLYLYLTFSCNLQPGTFSQELNPNNMRNIRMRIKRGKGVGSNSKLSLSLFNKFPDSLCKPIISSSFFQSLSLSLSSLCNGENGI